MVIRLFLTISLALWIFSGAGPAWAETEGATAQVKAVLDKAMEIQTREDLQGDNQRKQRAKLTRQLISESFLSAEMARESVSDQWSKISPQQRIEFQNLFADLFQDSYTRMVLNFLKKETIEYSGESQETGGTRVGTVIMRANEHIPVDYHLTLKGGRWFIRDVDIDGVSIVGNYKSTFRRVIQSQSFGDLLNKMRVQKRAISTDAGA